MEKKVMTKKTRRTFFIEDDMWALYGSKVKNRSDDIRKHIYKVCGLADDEAELTNTKKELLDQIDLIDRKLEEIKEASKKFNDKYGEETERLEKAMNVCRKHAEANGFIGRNIISDKAKFFKVNEKELERKLSLLPEIKIENFQEMEKVVWQRGDLLNKAGYSHKYGEEMRRMEEKTGKNEGRLFENDLNYAVSVLHRIHNALMKFEPLSDTIYKEGEEAMFLMSNWTTDDKDTNKLIKDIILLLDEQLTTHRKLVAKKERLWKDYQAKLRGEQTSVLQTP